MSLVRLVVPLASLCLMCTTLFPAETTPGHALRSDEVLFPPGNVLPDSTLISTPSPTPGGNPLGSHPTTAPTSPGLAPKSLDPLLEKAPLKLNVILSFGVLAFGAVLLLAELGIIYQVGQGWNSGATTVLGLTLMVFASLFALTAGYTEQQISPIIGLFGTLAGYVLGKGEFGKSAAPAIQNPSAEPSRESDKPGK